MNIINFISGNDLGGPKQSFLLYSRLLIELGYNTVSVVRANAKLVQLLQENNLPLKELTYFRTLISPIKHYSVMKIRSLFKPLDPDVIFVHKQIDIELVRQAMGDNVKIVGVVHGFNAKYIQNSDCILSVSEKVKAFIHKEGYTKRVYTIPNMINNYTDPKFKKIPKQPLIGAMGIFRRKKGFDTLIEALYILKKRGISFKSIIAGEGIRRPILILLRKKLRLQNDLEIRGWVSNSEREKFIDSIDIFVLPSRSESFGMVVAEAMARKKIVVATKCGGPEEILDHEINGYLVNRDDPKALADMLGTIITKQNNSKEIQEAAFDKSTKKYAMRSIQNKIKIILDDLSS